MAKTDVARYWPKQRDACSDQYGHARDYQSVDEPCRQESLNRNAAVYVSVFKPSGFELG